MCISGMRNLPLYPEIGNAVRAIEPICGSPQKFEAKYYEDERKALIFEEIGARNAVETGERLTGATMRGGKIEEVLCENISRVKRRFIGRNYSRIAAATRFWRGWRARKRHTAEKRKANTAKRSRRKTRKSS